MDVIGVDEMIGVVDEILIGGVADYSQLSKGVANLSPLSKGGGCRFVETGNPKYSIPQHMVLTPPLLHYKSFLGLTF